MMADELGWRVLPAAMGVATMAMLAPAAAQEVDGPRTDRPVVVTQTASVATGRLEGVVTDQDGRALEGAAVCAQGSGVNFAVSGRDGRFAFAGLPAGAYLVGAQRQGFSAAPRRIVYVRPMASTREALRLTRLSGPALEPTTAGLPPAPSMLVAGFGGEVVQIDGLDVEEPDAPDSAEPADHDHGATAWTIRHLRRSVLRETTHYVAGLIEDETQEARGGGASFLTRSARNAAAFFAEMPVSGRVRFLTTGMFDNALELFSSPGLPRSVAHVRFEGQSGGWAVEGATTQGDVSSWIVAGNYRTRPAPDHDVLVGLSYGTQRYEGSNRAALLEVSDGSRNVGALHAYDTWTPNDRTVLAYGSRYARYDYLDRSNLWSPSLAVSFSPVASTWIRGAVSQELLAPGAEEFVPLMVVGVWLPPERTFSSTDGSVMRPERTRHVEIGVEQEVASFVVGVRRFYQQVDDQLVTFFGVGAAEGGMDFDHYLVGHAGSVAISGWAASFAHPLGQRVSGRVEYSVTQADWSGAAQGTTAGEAAALAARPATEVLHDVSTGVETDIPETATRVLAHYRFNTGFASAQADTYEPRFDARFDVQVFQALPFIDVGSSEWELLVAVRNLFRDRAEGSSVYDELLVIRPPKRIVGGVSVRF